MRRKTTENEFNLIQMPDDRTVSDMYHLYQQESDIKQSELKATLKGNRNFRTFSSKH